MPGGAEKTSDRIRRLAREGCSVSEIAARLGIQYQHAYNVLKRNAVSRPTSLAAISQKPPLDVQTLLEAGFQHVSGWCLDSTGVLIMTQPLPREAGVYAFAKEEAVMYVGVATMGLAKRLYFYARPGVTQRTSLRIGEVIRRELGAARQIDILIAQPENLEWNGLPVHGAAGLELGLIKAYSLPWNMRSAK